MPGGPRRRPLPGRLLKDLAWRSFETGRHADSVEPDSRDAPVCQRSRKVGHQDRPSPYSMTMVIVTGWEKGSGLSTHTVFKSPRDRRGDPHRGIVLTRRAEDRARSRDQICRAGTAAARQIQLEADIRVGPPQRHACCAASLHPDVEPVNAVNAVGRGRTVATGAGTGLSACGGGTLLGAAGTHRKYAADTVARTAAASQSLIRNETAHLFIALPPDQEAGKPRQNLNRRETLGLRRGYSL